MRKANIRLLAAQQALVNLGLPVRVEDIKGLSPEEVSRKLLFLGIPENMTQKFDYRTTTANLIPVLASRDGIVTASKVVPGEMVDAAKNLFVISDTSQMWLILNVRNEDVKYLRQRDVEKNIPGHLVRFRPDGADKEVAGELIWLSNEVDEKDAHGAGTGQFAQSRRQVARQYFWHGPHRVASGEKRGRGAQRSTPLGEGLPYRFRARQGFSQGGRTQGFPCAARSDPV